MNIGDLKALIEDLDDEIEVRFASQPRWPFEYEISDGQVVNTNQNPTEDEETEQEYNDDCDPNEIFYLVEGNQLRYLPSVVADAIGW